MSNEATRPSSVAATNASRPEMLTEDPARNQKAEKLDRNQRRKTRDRAKEQKKKPITTERKNSDDDTTCKKQDMLLDFSFLFIWTSISGRWKPFFGVPSLSADCTKAFLLRRAFAKPCTRSSQRTRAQTCQCLCRNGL